MSRRTKTLKGIQVPGSISFKKLPKEAWRIASSLFKMAVEFSYEKYTCGGENSSRRVSVRCEQGGKRPGGETSRSEQKGVMQ